MCVENVKVYLYMFACECSHNIFVITFSKPGVSIFQPFHPFSGHLGVKATKGPVHSVSVFVCLSLCVSVSVCVCVFVYNTSRPMSQPPKTASITNLKLAGPGRAGGPG